MQHCANNILLDLANTLCHQTVILGTKMIMKCHKKAFCVTQTIFVWYQLPIHFMTYNVYPKCCRLKMHLSIFINQTWCVCPNSCSGGMCPAWAETASSRLSAKQQDSGALHEGGEELCPGRGAVQEGSGAGADHRDKVRDAHITADIKAHIKACLIVWAKAPKTNGCLRTWRAFLKFYFEKPLNNSYKLLWIMNHWFH